MPENPAFQKSQNDASCNSKETSTLPEPMIEVIDNTSATEIISPDPTQASTKENPKITRNVELLFDKILASGLPIISCQKDTPDPTTESQREELNRLYADKPGQFIFRFMSCLQPEDEHIFSKHQADPTVKYYLEKLLHKTSDYKVIRNRRYARLQELLADGAYFSDEEMKKRQPKLHYQMIGQFETEEEKDAKVREHLAGQEGKFSEFLLHQSDRSEYLESNVEEEEEEEEEEDDKEDMAQQGSKLELASQFQSIMMEKFLAGADTDHIVYQEIDDNERYDDLQIRTRDAEDAYFDNESEEESLITEEQPDDRPFNPPPLRSVATVKRDGS